MQMKDTGLRSRNREMVCACVGLWRRSVTRRNLSWLTMIPIIILLVGCSSAPPMAFLNNSHRQTPSLRLEDLQQVQFYLSDDVVATYQDASGAKSLLLPRLTPGVATSEGPNWIKVSFRDGGVDVPFITDAKQSDGRYYIATEVAGSKEFKRISDLPVRSFLYKGVQYNVASGGDALLLFDWQSWNSVVETRKTTEGRRVGGK
jgi:hypothetical protein